MSFPAPFGYGRNLQQVNSSKDQGPSETLPQRVAPSEEERPSHTPSQQSTIDKICRWVASWFSKQGSSPIVEAPKSITDAVEIPPPASLKKPWGIVAWFKSLFC